MNGRQIRKEAMSSIVELIKSHQREKDGLLWSAKMIAYHLGIDDIEHIRDEIRLLIAEGVLRFDDGEYRVR
jgi:hypothetical protein